MKTTRPLVEIDEALCDGCGDCIPSCHEGAIEIVNGKARLKAESLCDGLGACLGECPRGAIRIVEREADPFVAPEPPAPHPAATPAHGGCPGSQMRSLRALPTAAPAPRLPGNSDSELTHWPVQIGLIPPHAPFLKDAHLLVAADCVPIAYAHFHRDFLQGRPVMIGCPKFDDLRAYVMRFKALFEQSPPSRVTVAVMEVPCCQGLPQVVRQGMAMAGKEIPLEIAVIGLDGTLRNLSTV